MNTAELSFLTICFFMLHEFEEIITIRSWIQKNESDKKLSKEMFIKGKKQFHSTETISLMIMEEFILASIILLVAIRFQIKEIVIGIFIVYTLHLFGHIFQCVKFRKWTPGSRTAIITILPISYTFYITFSNNDLNTTNIVIWTFMLLSVLAFNLQLLHLSADKIENWRKNHL